MAKISILVPVFNAEKYLEECLNSLKNQTFSDWECIIVDDGSTDKSLQIATEFANSDERFKIFSLEHCGNPQKVRDFARLHSKGDWLLALDADDFLTPNCLEKLVKRQEETNADVVLMQLSLFDNETNKVIQKIPRETFDLTQICSGSKAVSMTIGQWDIANNGLFRKKLYKNTQYHSKNVRNIDEYAQRVVLFRAKIVAFSDAGYFYRQHPESLTKRPSERHFSQILSIKYLKILPVRVILWVARIHTSLKRIAFR